MKCEKMQTQRTEGGRRSIKPRAPSAAVYYILTRLSHTEKAKKIEDRTCKACSEGEVTTREHVVRCTVSGTKHSTGPGNIII